MKKTSTKTLCDINKHNVIFILMLIILIIAGSFYVRYTWNINMEKLSNRALDLAETAEAGLPKEYLYQLEMNEDDLLKPEYNQLKYSLIEFVNVNKNIRFAYIYKEINSKFYFIVDSELRTSENYSPPGQEYPEAVESDLLPYIYEKSIITEPLTDRWGTWISVLVPMKDRQTGEVLAVFGVDYPASEWLDYVKERTFHTAIFVVCFILLVSTLYSILIRNIKLRAQQKQMTILINELEQVKNTLDRAQSIAHVGNWELILQNKQITASNEAFQIYGLKSTNSIIPFEEVKRIPLEDERVRLDLALKNLIGGKEKYELEYRIRRADTGEVRVIHSNAVLELDAKGKPYKVIGVIWDITEHKESENKLRENEELFRTLFEQSPVGITFGSFNGEMFEMNQFFQKMVGRSKEELYHIKWESITHAEDIEKDKELFEKLAKGEISRYTLDKRYFKPDGSIVWASITVAPIYINNKTGITHLCIAEDITERIRKENELKESERSKLVLLSNIPGMAYQCKNDSIYALQFVSDGCYELTGYKTEELLMNENSYYDLIIPEYKEKLSKKWLIAIENKTVFCEEYPITNAAGDIVWVFEQGRGVYDVKGEIAAIEGLIINITDRKMKEREIQYLNDHDFLTGLFNRRYLEAMKSKINKADALPLTVMIGDINGVKFINDAFGHTEGDKLIYQTANILKACCRKEDIVARTGGDEFSFLLPNAGNDVAIAILNKIKYACEQYNNNISNEAHYINISLGYCTITSIEQDINEAIKIAEDYMYKHKLLEHKSSHSVIISSIKATMFARSQETEEHAGRLICLSRKVGEHLKLSQNELDELELLSTLHDIGKVGINDRILNKEGALTEDEWIEMKKHPEIGYRIAMASPELASIAEYILCHHEQWDGKGYPQGLKGEEIPLLSRIIAVVDAYDAMTQDRIYRKALPREIAMAEIIKNAGKQFDEKIVDIFIHHVLNPTN